MPHVLRKLSIDADPGMLCSRLLLGAGGPYVVQYWSSIDKLYAYASNPSQEHRPAWMAFNRAVRKAPGAVGIWHETFLIDTAEIVYVSTKPMGLPKATELVPVGKRHDRAQARFAEGRTERGEAEAAQPDRQTAASFHGGPARKRPFYSAPGDHPRNHRSPATPFDLSLEVLAAATVGCGASAA